MQFVHEAFAIFVMLAILSILIIVHECGHFSVARFFGFQTPVFGFGLPFGPHWVVGTRWNTEFRIHACLLGGYVAIPELGDESNQDAFGVPLKPFRKFPIWQRALVAFAGVGFNIIFAYLIMLTMMLTMGEPNNVTVVSALPAEPAIAAKAGIKPDDELVSIDEQAIHSPDQAVSYLTSHKSTLVHVHVKRASQPLTIEMTTNENGKVGMALDAKGPTTYTKVEGNLFEIAGRAGTKLYTLTKSMVDALGEMMHGLFSSEKGSAAHPHIGVKDLHGVLAVIKIGADIAQQDWSQLFLFTILISMDLAIINLVPFPALDGGHLAFMTFEAIRGRPMNERVQGEIVKWGFISLIVLMVVIMVNDVTALCTGKLDFKKDASKNKGSAAPDQAQPPAGDAKDKDSEPKKRDTAAGTDGASSKTDTGTKTDAGAANPTSTATGADAGAANPTSTATGTGTGAGTDSSTGSKDAPRPQDKTSK